MISLFVAFGKQLLSAESNKVLLIRMSVQDKRMDETLVLEYFNDNKKTNISFHFLMNLSIKSCMHYGEVVFETLNCTEHISLDFMV